MVVVFDVNVLVSAALFKGSVPALCLQKAITWGNVFLSQQVLAELKETLNKPKLNKYITIKDRFVFINRLVNHANFSDVTYKIEECRDPKDNKYLELALSINAACIVSGDTDLLVLNPFQGIPIITPREFLDTF